MTSSIQSFADDHFDKLRAQVLGVTKAELDASAAIRLAPDELVSVIVGDASGFADEIASAGFGPVEVISDEG